LSIIDPQLPGRLEAILSTFTPIESLTSAEFKDLLRDLRLYQRDFEQADFGRFAARVIPAANGGGERRPQLVFPVRYIDGRLVGLRTLSLSDSEGGGRLIESHNPGRSLHPTPSLLPFPLGLHDAAAAASSSCCILVGSVLDAVVLRARLSERYVVAVLPDASNMSPAHIPFLVQFETIYVWLDNSSEGAQNAHRFAQKIDEKRCRVVTSEYPGAFQCVRKKLDIAEVLKSSLVCYHEFLTTFEKLRDTVYLEFLQSDTLLGLKWKRFDGLNSTLGGFRRGELTVFSGDTTIKLKIFF
jgi:hypothetical protein